MAADRWTLFLAKTERQPNGCLHWTGAVSKQGYGIVKVGSRSMKVHRYSFEHHYRPLEPDETVDHGCHNRDLTCQGGLTCLHRRCVEPTHLEAKGIEANKRGSIHALANKTHCKQGHEFTPENTAIRSGSRACRECYRARDRRRYWQTKIMRPVVPPKTHCKHGHEFTDENTFLDPNGYRQCRECHRRLCRENYWRKRTG